MQNQPLMLVGAGEYYRNFAGPSLKLLQELGIIGDLKVVDNRCGDGVDYVRAEGQSLSEIVLQSGLKNPVVILAHANNLHTTDAQELLTAKNISQGTRVLIEKPYATSARQFSTVERLFEKYPDRIGVLEYYLTMKAVPLLVFAGLVKENSFYFTDDRVLKVRSEGRTLQDISGTLEERVGKPLFVVSDLLEGEGSYGTIEHRNASLVDREKGGGMIQDLGHHALTPLLALSTYLGFVTSESFVGAPHLAYCNEYLTFAREKLGLRDAQIGESYAEFSLRTSKGVPITIHLGKYVQEGTNQRRITIVGTRGVVLYDMTNNVLSYQTGDGTGISSTPSKEQSGLTGSLLAADKSGAKYYPVHRAALETLSGNNPFTFNPYNVSLQAQDLVFSALQLANRSICTTYRQGAMHDTIFR